MRSPACRPPARTAQPKPAAIGLVSAARWSGTSGGTLCSFEPRARYMYSAKPPHSEGATATGVEP